MREQLIKLLGLNPKSGDEDIVKAVAAIKAAMEANQPGGREFAIREKMQITGMTRGQAEHVIDQQAKEDALRGKQASTSNKRKIKP